MLSRTFLALSALLLTVSVLVGVQVSGATWTRTTATPVAVAAADDWTPPVVTVAPLPAAVRGTVTLTATANDARSSIASVAVEAAAAGSGTWVAVPGCSATGTNPVTYTCVVDTTLVPDGGYQVRATATDTAGYSATSATVSTTVANNATAVLTPLPAAIKGTVPVRGDLAGVPGTVDLFLEYRTGATWTQLDNGCTAQAPTVQCAWATTAVADGTYDVRLRASSGHTATQSGVVVDNTAPSKAEVVVPAAPLSGTVTLTANAADATSGVASVEFQHRVSGAGAWSGCGTDSTAPYSCNLDTTTLTNGTSYDFRVVVTDRAGSTTTSATVARIVDNTPSTVSITSPAAGATVDGTVAVDVSASSPSGVTQVRVDYRALPGGSFTPVCTDTSAPYSCSWDTSQLSGGYELQAVMTRGQGNDVTSATRTVTVDHTASASISAPAAGATVRNQASVSVTGTYVVHQAVSSLTLTATPTSPTGTPTTTTCSVAAGSFNCGWNTSAVVYGQYDLQVRLTKADGTAVTSSTNHVTVDNAAASVSVTSPAAAAYVGATTTLSATASSNAGVSSVRFEVRPTGTTTWATACTVTTPVSGSYSCPWNTSATTYGSYEVRAVMAQGLTAPDFASSAVATTVDNRVLGAYDVDGVKGGVIGTIDAGDKVVLTYTGLVNLGSIQSGLTYGSAVPVTVTLGGNSGNSADTLSFGTANLGTVTLSARFIKNNKNVTYQATMTATQDMDPQNHPVTVITVTLGTPASTGDLLTGLVANTMTWAPVAVTDVVGRSSVTTAVTERGGADQDF
ncbi:Ig-like domain-containing protein [Nocardioides sp. MAHUQ-72]|uniref:Ig-like domain-containing protein n=1 Tax=unclassified Nocardioides TaxID=2615069 RepID=UPI003614738C